MAEELKERKAFEAWAASVGYHTERDMFQREKYQSTLTWELWRVWQARAALSANHSDQVRVPDVDLAMHLLSDRWPESSERIEVEVFAEWLRDLLAAAPSAGSQKEQGE